MACLLQTSSAIPGSTYRLQLSSKFSLEDAANVVPYLSELGISHLYLSPVLMSRPGSTHGYDIVDHECIDSELGGVDGWQRLCEVARGHAMGLILDVVPNHMAADPSTIACGGSC